MKTRLQTWWALVTGGRALAVVDPEASPLGGPGLAAIWQRVADVLNGDQPRQRKRARRRRGRMSRRYF